jgi:hypothetical protein
VAKQSSVVKTWPPTKLLQCTMAHLPTSKFCPAAPRFVLVPPFPCAALPRQDGSQLKMSTQPSPAHMRSWLPCTAASYAAAVPEQQSRDTAGAASVPRSKQIRQPPPGSPAGIVQQAGIQVPPYCCGCGVKLQQVDPEAPGCVLGVCQGLHMPSLIP